MNRSLSFAARSLLALALLAGGIDTLRAAPRAAEPARVPAAVSPWRLQDNPAARPDREAAVPTTKFQAFTADLTKLRAQLAGAPLDIATAAARGTFVTGNPVEITLPMPRGGQLARFRVEEIAIMEPALAAKYPDIKTYRGTGIDDPAAQLALDVTPFGMHAQILSPSGRVYISPYYFGAADDLYASYYKEDARLDPTVEWVCEFKSPVEVGRSIRPNLPAPIVTPDEARAAGIHPANPAPARVAPEPHTTFSGSLRTYRLAVAANHQYVATTGGTTASAMAAIVVVINRVSAIYEADCSLRLVIVANNNLIIYPDAATDPFTANDTTVINTSTATISAAIGAANYDIGHVFTTGSGGISGLGVVCTTTTKGRSTTGLPTPIGDAFNVDFVVHEMGHEFGANHTFNGNTSNCGGGNRSATHAYEPGSGSTIMAYAGICGVTSDLQPHSDSMFHSESIMEILTYTAGTGGTCPVVTTNTNSAPVVSAGPSYTIPISTPFTLTGSATDPDMGDVLTYSWEERDKGAAQTGIAADNGAAPIFRTFAPVYSPSRTFPKMSDLVNNTTTIGEQLPTLARAALTFRLTVRDNRTGGGATNSADVALVVSAAAGPFLVTAPNTAITVASGGALAVSWNVAGTSAAPVSVANVSILLSTDGGYTYPITLAASTPNNGSTTVTLPAGLKTTTARVKVAAVGNIFFDISDTNFSIQ